MSNHENFMSQLIVVGRFANRHKVGRPLLVFVRIRPVLPAEESNLSPSERAIRCVYPDPDDKSILTLQPPPQSQALKSIGDGISALTFNQVFGAESTQQEVFNTTTLPLVEGLFRGENGLIFAYGITNSGKTHTMQGSPGNPGILCLAIQLIFARIEEEANADVQDYTVTASMLEIYNERIFDLLDPQRKECRLQKAIKDSVFVSGLKELSISSSAEADAVVCLHSHLDKLGHLQFIHVIGCESFILCALSTLVDLFQVSTASRCRTIGKTGSNNNSSRSHTVFTIKLKKKGSKQVWARLSIVDLAGAERVKKTENMGDRLAESHKINTSLMHLGRCLEILRENQKNGKSKPIPFRDSKITRLFQDSLSGWGNTVDAILIRVRECFCKDIFALFLF
jgi:hypothetical protein